MRYSLEQFSSAEAAEHQRLVSLGITNTDQLLERAALPAGREALAQQSGIPIERLTRLSGLADLIRVKGIGPALAESLVDSGAAGNLQQLIERNADIPALRQTIRTHMASKGRIHAPTIYQLTEICAEARELRPRLLLQSAKPDSRFRQDVFSRARQEYWHSARLSLGMTAAVVIPIALAIFAGKKYMQSLVADTLSPYEDLNQLLISAEQAYINLTVNSISLAFFLLFGALVILIAAYDFTTYLQSAWLPVLLFSTPGHQKFYKQIISIDLMKQVRSLWWAVAVLALAGFIMAAIAVYTIMNNPYMDNDFLLREISKVIIPLGVLIGIIASWPVLSFFRKMFSGTHDYSQEQVKRYFIYYMVKVIMLPLLVVLFTQIILPSVFAYHTEIMIAHVIPQARNSILENRQQLVNLEIVDSQKKEWRNLLVEKIDSKILLELDTQMLIITPEDNSALDMLVPAALNMVIWIALTALLLLFVVPYLILGGWARGIFYMVLLWASFALENRLTISAPTWFQLPPDSVAQGPFIAFFVFINALFFDWLFEATVERKKICPACKTELDQDSMFCAKCGFQQE